MRVPTETPHAFFLFCSQNENEDRQREKALEARIEKVRNLAADKAMVEAERLQKVLNYWFGRVLKKSLLIWKNYLGWRRGGKAMHIENVRRWRRLRDMKNTFRELRNVGVKLRLQRKLGSLDPE